jgi:hypothetical protein
VVACCGVERRGVGILGILNCVDRLSGAGGRGAHGNVSARCGAKVDLITVLAPELEAASAVVEQADVAHAFLVVVKDFGGIGDGLMGGKVIAKRGMGEERERDIVGF